MTRKPQNFITSLESVRGIAAMMVLLAHACSFLEATLQFRTLWQMETTDELARRLVFTLANGAAAVSTFFVLSGFVLALSLKRDGRPGAFLVRRIFRIYPALAVNVVLLALTLWLLIWLFPDVPFTNYTAGQLWENLALLAFDVNPPTGSLLIELLAIPMIIVCHLVARRFGIPGLLVILGIGIAAVFVGPATWSTRVDFQFVLGMYIVDYQFMFTAGMLAAEWHSRHRLHIQSRSALACLIVAIVVALSARAVFGYYSRTAILLEGFGATAVILLLAAGPRTLAHSALEWRPIRFLGRVSYSLYLYHVTAMWVIKPVMRWSMTDTGIAAAPYTAAAISTVLTIVATLPLAWASYVLIERPFIAAATSFVGRGNRPTHS